PVTVYRFDVTSTTDPLVYRAEIECSSGTYVRTLGADLGEALGGGAHIRELRRTAIGSFVAETQAVPLNELDEQHVLVPSQALRDYPAVTVTDEVAAAVRHGKVLSLDVVGDLPGESSWPAGCEQVWRVLDEAGDLLAVYGNHGDGIAKPAVVIQPAAT
ncbi:MAG: hypothetical protein ACR2H3_14520, partial [Acidimicrobiales bacterium]